MTSTLPAPLTPCACARGRAIAAPPARRVIPVFVAHRPARDRWRHVRRQLALPLAILRHRLVRYALVSAAVIAFVLGQWLNACVLTGTLLISAPCGIHARRRVPPARPPKHPPKPGDTDGRPLGTWRRSAEAARQGGAYLPAYPYACSQKAADACRAPHTPHCHRFERASAHEASGRYCRLRLSPTDGTAPPDRAPLRAARPRAARRYQRG